MVLTSALIDLVIGIARALAFAALKFNTGMLLATARLRIFIIGSWASFSARSVNNEIKFSVLNHIKNIRASFFSKLNNLVTGFLHPQLLWLCFS